jgi:hypothetical protein
MQTQEKVRKIAPPEPGEQCQALRCPAYALITVAVETGDLQFCRHHFQQFLGIPKFAAAMIGTAERGDWLS